MPSVNQKLADAAISHAVDLQHYSNGVVHRLIALLNRVDSDLAARLTVAIDSLPIESFTVERLDALLVSVRVLNVQAYQAVEQDLNATLAEFVRYEAAFQHSLFVSAIPAQVTASIGVNQVVAEQVYAAALSRPFQGRLLREWAASIEADRMIRIRDAVRMGYVQGETVSDIVRRVRGTRARGYGDGIIEIDRRHAESVVRTAISHTAGYTRDQFNKENGDLVKAVGWLSTLDTHTTEICILRDGKEYTPESHKPIGHSLPWLGGPGAAHWNCRSVSVPITKSLRELGLNVDDFTPSVRASMDGQVPAETKYGDWLKNQSAARQDQVLGPTRGKLLRDGGLTVDRFANDKGKWLDLATLRERDAAAFTKAGL